MKNTVLNLEPFYPRDSLEIMDAIQDRKSIIIHLKSNTTKCECPSCHVITNKYHGIYVRRVQVSIPGHFTAPVHFLYMHKVEQKCYNKYSNDSQKRAGQGFFSYNQSEQ